MMLACDMLQLYRRPRVILTFDPSVYCFMFLLRAPTGIKIS